MGCLVSSCCLQLCHTYVRWSKTYAPVHGHFFTYKIEEPCTNCRQRDMAGADGQPTFRRISANMFPQQFELDRHVCMQGATCELRRVHFFCLYFLVICFLSVMTLRCWCLSSSCFRMSDSHKPLLAKQGTFRTPRNIGLSLSNYIIQEEFWILISTCSGYLPGSCSKGHGWDSVSRCLCPRRCVSSSLRSCGRLNVTHDMLNGQQ